ncbi:hypothetical protein EV421DRAFT_1888209 [Armillaria borealis]|uniref:DASH complex subunit DAM1 n=1 Tax=Armillaria borealis TaxID=47425 RepID=A0AA39K180_9AGAR|nr:hypothetical protein EV421DRAFT_1888209 [Armillaria borealis]
MPLPSQTPHRTPLRRISQGSLFRLSRSGANPDTPHGLGFLEPAMAEFIDETEALQNNVEGLKHLSDSLATFNESFASLLYVMDMNALTTDWPQAPTDASFLLARRRAEEDALAALQAAEEAKRKLETAAGPSNHADKTTATVTELETTYMTAGNTTKSSAPQKKKGKKPKLTTKEKKERSLEIEKIVSCLPLEFRGSDPTLRRNMEMVVEGMIDASNQVVKLTDLILPDLPQARVNKCLIALVNRKIVRKDNSTGVVLYHWQGLQ